jgi:ubiquinone/menaquinone biosynthesis C-methylase UbiE
MPFADFKRWRGQRVLEVGAGMGTDLIGFAKAGANATGLDLSLASLRLARENSAGQGLCLRLINADAEKLPFEDNAFDLVYSWGVLHHTPNIQMALREIRRVLKPGAECRIMLYHRHSLNALLYYLRYGLGRARPFTSVSELIGSHLESPGTKAFRTAEARSLFRDFGTVDVRAVITAYDVRVGARRMAPRWVLRMVPDQLGWFLLIHAQK